MAGFVGLHRHTGYSMLDGLGKIEEQIVPRLRELGQNACACTDHGSIFGHLDYYNVLKNANLKPILGVEAYHVNDMRLKGKEASNREKRGLRRNEYAHLTILAATNEGYGNLLKLSNASYRDGYYYVPRVDWPEVVKYQKGLVVLSGCIVGRMSQLILEDRAEDAFNMAKWVRERIEHFYIEIIPCPSLDSSFKTCPILWKIGEELGIPQVLTDDAHFPAPEHAEAQDAVFTLGQGKKLTDPNRYYIPRYHYYCSETELLERAYKCLPKLTTGDLQRALDRTRQIADKCDVELRKSRGPIFPVAANYSAEAQLQKWIAEGRAYRRSLGLLPEENTPEWKVYLEREAYEWEILTYHNFINYFLLISDIIRWCNQNDIWCIARGSCGGSLLCWYLGITQIDPIKFRLPVERFVDKTRKDMPDVDLDFDARYRDRVFAYLREKYGEDHCAQVAAISRFGARQAIRDAGRVFDIPTRVIDEILLLVPERDVDEGIKAEHILERFFADNPDIQPYLEKYPQLRLAALWEGNPRQTTIHAAGFIVDEEPLDRIVGVAVYPGRPPVATCDKEGAARQGFLKLDALSVNMLSVIKIVLETIGKDLDWLYRLPLDDKATYQTLSRGRNMGVFQLQGTAAGRLMREIKPQNFYDLMAICGLARPGPLQSGGAEEYIERRWGRSEMPKYHPIVREIVAETNGIILFQEQVMKVAQMVGQFPMEEVHKVRKAVASVRGADAVAPFKEAYLKGALAQNIPEEDALHVWAQCLKAGNYVFNQAHNTQYALIGYWSAYLKTHYSALFTATFAEWQEHSGDREKRRRLRNRLFQEFKDQGGQFLLLDYNRSEEGFQVIDEHTILGGFGNIDGCGTATARELIKGRPYDSWNHFLQRCPKVIRERLASTGIHTGDIDLDMALRWAPWYIEIAFTEFEKRAFERLRCQMISDALENRYPDVRIMGRVTGITLINTIEEAKKYGGTIPEPGLPYMRAVITINDPTGSLDVFLNPGKLDQILTSRKPFEGESDGIANTVYVQGTLAGDRSKIYGNDMMLVRAAKGISEAQRIEIPRAHRRIKRKDLKQIEKQLVLEM